MNSDPDKAKARFWILQSVLFSGAVLSFLAVAIVGGKFPSIPEELGYVVLLAAVLTFFLLPNLIRRRWKRQDGNS